MKTKSLFSVLLLLFSLFGCSVATNENVEVVEDVDTTVETSTEAVKEDFIVGFDAEYPPFGFLSDDGTYTGFDLELAEEFCNRNNLNFVAQPIDWDSKDLELNSGSIDCIWNGFTINGREDKYEWTVPYVDNSIVLVVRSDSEITSFDQLNDKVVTVQAGSSGYAAITDEENEKNANLLSSFKELTQCADYNTAFMELESGVVDCVIVDIGVAKYQLKNNSNFVQLEEVLSSEQYGIGFKLGNVELRDKVENTLFDMWNDGTVSRIANKYSDYSIPDALCLDKYID